MFRLEDKISQNIQELFPKDFITKDFQNRIRQSVRVLHFEYLWGACRQAQITLKKYNLQTNLFDYIMNIYNTRRLQHQANFLLLHCFENALRSTLAVEIANLYNTSLNDEWFLQPSSQNVLECGLLKKIQKICKIRNLDIKDFKNTFEVFDLFSMYDLQYITQNHYEHLKHIFASPKQYKQQPLQAYGKTHLISKINQIRNARNFIYHNKPTKIKYKKDLEILLLRMGFNLNDATMLPNIREAINLKYKY